MHRKRVNISTVLAGQRVGIKEVDDGTWIVSFTQYDLGFIDLEQKTLQPLDNPLQSSASRHRRHTAQRAGHQQHELELRARLRPRHRPRQLRACGIV